MNKIVAVHQPNFAPWLGYFDKMHKSDVFVLIDDVQYVKGHICNRNKLKNNQGKAVWLTVPVKMSKGAKVDFNKLPVDYDQKWQPKLINALRGAYQKSPHFDTYIPSIKDIINREFPHLAALNITLIRHFKALLNLNTRLEVASKVDEDFGARNEMNMNICKYFGGDVYLSGQGARKYNAPELFAKNNIDLQYQEFDHPVYDQLHGEFIPNLSILDLIFNCGPDSERILKSSGGSD